MTVKKFNREEDYERISRFLSDCYQENQNMLCWLPERFDDLIFRVDVLYKEERGQKASADYIYLFEKNDEIVGVILPDGDSFNSCIKNGYEFLFKEMLDLAEKELLPLFSTDENGEVSFLVISHDSLSYLNNEAEKEYIESRITAMKNGAEIHLFMVGSKKKLAELKKNSLFHMLFILIPIIVRYIL